MAKRSSSVTPVSIGDKLYLKDCIGATQRHRYLVICAKQHTNKELEFHAQKTEALISLLICTGSHNIYQISLAMVQNAPAPHLLFIFIFSCN